MPIARAALVLGLGQFAGTAHTLQIETKTLDELYAGAFIEGGQFVLHASRDELAQICKSLDRFYERFLKL